MEVAIAVSCVVYILCVVGICVVVLAYVHFRSQADSCHNTDNFWCSDEFYCNTVTPEDPKWNICYSKKDHLHSCLFGPSSAEATRCRSIIKDKASCPCNIHSSGDVNSGNCLAGCPKNFGAIDAYVNKCCCRPGHANCPNKVDPPNCMQSGGP